MVQSTKSGKGPNLGPDCGTEHDRSTCWRVLRKSQMRPVLVIVEHILGHQTLQMPLIQDDDVIQQVPSATADPALSNAVLPWTTKRCSHGRASHLCRERHHVVAKLRVTVEQ